jgi:catechol 2,3-dioxygenase-like lactoylglutathione lyase family enzyme
LPEWNKNAAGIKAFYFRDPDGHFLEILQFPPDKGNAKWHRDTNKLFLGIDHTAIVVADMDESLKFYRDKLGMRVVGNSENFGFEQEHLNGVFGAHLLITTLHADQGPGVELLEYLSPTDGREAASDTRPNDVAHWTIHLAAAEVPPIATKFGAAPARAVSREASAATAFELLDPDRHAVSISSAKGN